MAQDLALADTTALDATLAAPLPEVTADRAITRDQTLRSTNNSVLPRLSGGAPARLVASEGRRYEAVKVLGRGGMGEVALVEDRDIGRQVALKRLLGGVEAAPAVARFVDEVRTIGRLEHPNIIPIHDVGIDENGALFFVMKLVEGETLEAIIDRLRAGDPDAHREYDVTRRVEIFVGMLRALQYAHAHGVIHRDLKPANVMIGRHGEVVLMDWGVARPIGGAREGDGAAPAAATTDAADRASVTHHGALIGTPLYMSPEQASGANDSLDARSDLYSACVVLHEMLGLRHRFAHIPTLPALLVAIQTTDPPPHREMMPPDAGPVGPEYIHFLRRGLRRDPAERWQSADEMIYELHAALDGRLRVQCPVTFTKRVTRELGRFVDRSPQLALATAAVVTTGILALLANAVIDLIR